MYHCHRWSYYTTCSIVVHCNIGGYGIDDRIFSSVARLQMTTGVWTKDISSLSIARAGATSAVIRGTWMVCGGMSHDGIPLATVEALDAATGVWEALPSMQQARCYATSAVFGGRLFVFGTHHRIILT